MVFLKGWIGRILGNSQSTTLSPQPPLKRNFGRAADDVRTLIGDDRGPVACKRDYKRIAVNIPIRLRVDPEGRNVEYSAHMLDCSEGGAKLAVPIRLEWGDIVEIIPAEGPKFSVQARVVWADRLQGSPETKLGVQLLRSLPRASWLGKIRSKPALV